MQVVCIKNMHINLPTKIVVPEWARVYKDRTYTVNGVEVENGVLMYRLAEISADCIYVAKNFVPLDKFLETISIEKLIEEEILELSSSNTDC